LEGYKSLASTAGVFDQIQGLEDRAGKEDLLIGVDGEEEREMCGFNDGSVGLDERSEWNDES